MQIFFECLYESTARKLDQKYLLFQDDGDHVIFRTFLHLLPFPSTIEFRTFQNTTKNCCKNDVVFSNNSRKSGQHKYSEIVDAA